MQIDCDVTSTTCQPFYHKMWDSNDQMIVGHWESSTIEIDLVYMGRAKNSGHCTKAVSYMLKVLLLESAKMKRYPFIGRVYISSSIPCAAVNCYTHAFINNGFLPSEKELEEFKADSTNIDFDSQGSMYDTFDFTFEDFTNQSQMEKFKNSIHRRNKRKRKLGDKKKKKNKFKWIANRVKLRRRNKDGTIADRVRRRRGKEYFIKLKF